MWLRIPIDFCLVSEEITIRNKTIGTDIGSDHFPLIVDFALTKD
jgi:endonuclease/exonuclease/phosphatase (EEP) superfamily protein YafD